MLQKFLIVLVGMAVLAGCAQQVPVKPKGTATALTSPLASPLGTPAAGKRCSPPVLKNPKLGVEVCITGIVTIAYNEGNDFYMKFDDSPQSVYGVAHNYFYWGVEGTCVEMVAPLQQDATGRYYLQLDVSGQVGQCVP